MHYIIYIMDLTNGLTTNFTTTGPETSIAVFTVMPTMPCSMSIEVSAVNPGGEGHRSTSVIIDCEQFSCLVIRCKINSDLTSFTACYFTGPDNTTVTLPSTTNTTGKINDKNINMPGKDYFNLSMHCTI